jgi:carbamoyltransferase
MTAILGISAFFHDSAAALVIDGRIVAAAQEERFSRKKHDSGFPVKAIGYCLREAGIEASDLDYVGFYDKPLRKFDRLLESYLAYVPRGFESFVRSMPVWLRQKLYLNREIDLGLARAFRKRHIFLDHHESHAASAFFPSPFEEAAILTLDGVGEWGTASFGSGRGHRVELTHELRFPHSLGLLYTAFTYFTGFAVNSDEYKMMGLAPYGEPTYVDLILERLIDLKEDGSFRLDMSFFDYCHGLTMTSKKFERLFGGPPRRPEGPITQREMDLAASIQKVTEEIMLRCARHAHARTGMKNLCLAGGVALNCVGNGRILREGPFENIWIQPAADDAGGALGVALFIWHQLLGNPRVAQPTDSQSGSFLGPAFSDDEIRRFLDAANARYEYIPDDALLCDEVADALASQNVVGWFQGRMEFGPRALGGRSILGDPRWPAAQTVMNQKVKFREGFRPFAPSVLAEEAPAYFSVNGGCESPYMLLVAPVAEDKRRPLGSDEQDVRGLDKLKVQHSTIPSVTHVDYSARIQTVDPDRHGIYRRLVESFHRKTRCPVVVNTSFNLGWDPIVCTPEDAYRTFMSSDIDALCMGHFLLRKAAQPAWVRDDGTEPFLDLLASPCCRAPLSRSDGGLRCGSCGHAFPAEDGIAQLFWPHESIGDSADVTEIVKSFYEDSPFPNYDDHDSIRSLIDKSRRGIYARRLNDAIPYNSAVLEVGCGTGQLSNFLGIGCRRVVGTDMCMNSLRLGEDFRRRHDLKRVRFVQMNLFRPSLAREKFDVVLCNGVLHHTAAPFEGFRSLVPLLRPGGHIVIGLYNRYGRVLTDLRRMIFRATNGRGQWLDPQLRAIGKSREKSRSWFADQYRHPHESKHTVDEVLGWFESCGIEFVRGLPSLTLPRPGSDDGDLFAPTSPGGAMEHFVTQLGQVVTGNREGGFFVLIGRKPAAAQDAASSRGAETEAWQSSS